MPPAYEVLLLNTAVPQIQAAQSGDTYVVPRDIAFSAVANLANGTYLLPALAFSSDPDTGIFRQGANALGFVAGGGSDQMVLTTTGLGIGTSSPTGILNIKTSNGQLLVQNGTSANQMRISAFNNAGNANAALIFEGYSSEYGRFDTSGNLGLGVTPSAWSGLKGFQINTGFSFGGSTVNGSISSNSFYDGADWKYITSTFATRYDANFGNNGSHAWLTAPSGTAGNAITFTQAMTLDASGNLLVNRTSVLVNSKVSVDGSLGLNGASGGGVLRLYSADTFYGGIASAAWAFGGGASATDLTVYASNNFIVGAGGSERARITSGGNLDLQNNIGLGGASATTSGTGITFPATQSASSDANTLDDYEEGTWTPNVTASSGSITTVGTVSGSYTKVGRVVHAFFSVAITANGTGASSILIANIPFNPSAANTSIGVFREQLVNGKMGSVNLPNTTQFQLQLYDNTYPASSLCQLVGEITYYV